MTKNLSLALYTKFNEQTGGVYNDFHVKLVGKLFKEVAPQDATYPRATYHILTNTHEWSFKEDYSNVLVQFNIYTKDSSSSRAEDIAKACIDLYRWCQLTITDHDFVYMRDENSVLFQDSDGIWVYSIQFRVLYDN